MTRGGGEGERASLNAIKVVIRCRFHFLRGDADGARLSSRRRRRRRHRRRRHGGCTIYFRLLPLFPRRRLARAHARDGPRRLTRAARCPFIDSRDKSFRLFRGAISDKTRPIRGSDREYRIPRASPFLPLFARSRVIREINESFGDPDGVFRAYLHNSHYIAIEWSAPARRINRPEDRRSSSRSFANSVSERVK